MFFDSSIMKLMNILKTKLFIPQPELRFVTRNKLLEQLQNGPNKKLTLVSASAGFGKTSLISHWLTLNETKAVWFSIDGSDNDLSTFFSYILTGFKNLKTCFGEKLKPLLSSRQKPEPEEIVSYFINEIVSEPEKYILVLDDYHYITIREIHQALNFLLDHVPPNLHLVLITRADPPFSLSRLRIRGQVTEIRSDDLRFSDSETKFFLNDLMGLTLDRSEISILGERTEGWIAALKLAALSLKSHEKKSFITSFTGSNRYIVDYLVEEVLAGLAEEVNRFLLETSVLDRFSAELASAVVSDMSTQKCGSLLIFLENENLFLVPLDSERRWFRYHHLFSCFLLQQLRHKLPGHEKELLTKAGDWYEDQGSVDDAIEYAFRAQKFERAASFIKRVAHERIMHMECKTVKGWFSRLPETLLKNHPCFYTTCAWAFFFHLEFEKVDELLNLGLLYRGDDPQQRIATEANVIQSFLKADQQDYEASRKHASLAKNELGGKTDEFSLVMKALVCHAGVKCDHFEGRLSVDKINYKKAAELNRQIGNFNSYFYILGIWAERLIYDCELFKAKEILDNGLAKISSWEKENGRASLATSWLDACFGKIYYEWDEVEKAREYSIAAIKQFERGGTLKVGIKTYSLMITVCQAEDNPDEALLWLKKLKNLKNLNSSMPKTLREQIDELIIIHKMQLAKKFKKLDFLFEDAKIWIDDNLGEFELEAGSVLDICSLGKIFIFMLYKMKEREFKKSLITLEKLIPITLAGNQKGVLIRCLLFKSIALYETGDRSGALKPLTEALLVGSKNRFVRSILDLTAFTCFENKLLNLLSKADTTNIPGEYIDSVTTSLQTGQHVSRPETATQKTERACSSLPEPLKARELSILRALNGPLSNSQIAEELYLSVNTVKWYVKNIYMKLGVNSRSEAVEYGKGLKII